VEQLLSQHFERGRDTSDRGVLLDCAAAARVPADAAAAALAPSSAAREWVWTEDARARAQLRVAGVPHYAVALLAGAEGADAAAAAAAPPVATLTLEGAQPHTAWLDAFAALRRAAAAAARDAA
jgi:predicted DsbA family dithiol-disulfide isomerase